ncbi:MAG: hypothetical protein C0598_00145 [Marinilabiliales bacterium]|nr:MAG: hypothetical protein C0598_00145 [Marinilabiliales bacterium]
MNKYYTINSFRLLKPIILAVLTIIISTTLLAGKDSHIIIISGQVINKEYGNPVEGHAVYVEDVGSDISDRSGNYLSELYTNNEGYYTDTIITNLEKGSFKISTHDYKGNLIDTIVHFRFLNYAAFNVNIANFRIYMPYHTEKLQAKFRYYQKNSDNRFKFTFRDLTAADSIIKWQWDFGDGDSSYVQHPVHTYKGPGVYKVKFTVTIKVNSKIESNTITSLIYISDKSFFHMGGQAFSGYFPIDKGLAYLYIIDDKSNYIPVDTVKFDTLGYYIFYQIPEGKYCVKVQPDNSSASFDEFLPTYYGDVIYWEDAQIIDFTATNWDKDIYLIPNEGLKDGVGILDGYVMYSEDGENNFTNKTVEKVDLYLMSEDNNVYLSKYSNETGFFDFSNIPVGTYWIYPELTGIRTQKRQFTLTEDNPTLSDIQVIIGPDTPDFIIDNLDQQSLISNIFPNPAKDFTTLNLSNTEHDLIIELLDLSGKIIIEDNITSTQTDYRLNISDIKSGMYIIRVYNGKINNSRTLIVN